jgi:hypothetical protein
MSIEPTTSANSTVTCLNSACEVGVVSGQPQASQYRAPALAGGAPHDVQATAAAVIRALRGPGVFTQMMISRRSTSQDAFSHPPWSAFSLGRSVADRAAP